MRCRIELGGHSAEWDFGGSEVLGAWVAEAPWTERVELRLLRLARTHTVGLLLDWLVSAVPGADQRRSRVSVEALSAGSENLEAWLCERCSVETGLDRVTRRRRLAGELAIEPLVVGVPFTGPTRRDELGRARDLIEAMVKEGPATGLAVLAIDSHEFPAAEDPAFDLGGGGPSRVARGWLLKDAPSAWRGYAHLRIAWEAGGDPIAALELDTYVATCRFEDDDAFEGALNTWARANAARNPGALAVAEQWLSAGGRANAAQAVAHRVGWHPPGAFGPQPVPWVARVLLLEGKCDPARERLRSTMQCAPLARLLLEGCFDLESDLRARLDARGVRPTQFSQLTRDRHRDYVAAPGEGVGKFYPAGCPAKPGGPLSFASLGETANHLARGAGPIASELRALTDLRNAIAHGHYVAWSSVAQFRRIHRALA